MILPTTNQTDEEEEEEEERMVGRSLQSKLTDILGHCFLLALEYQNRQTSSTMRKQYLRFVTPYLTRAEERCGLHDSARLRISLLGDNNGTWREGRRSSQLLFILDAATWHAGRRPARPFVSSREATWNDRMQRYFMMSNETCNVCDGFMQNDFDKEFVAPSVSVDCQYLTPYSFNIKLY